ncbi:MAG: hypothetical protein O2783_04680 [Chloroflexi bacterium]|nr:hypothetical protein [Chloroflexota bacterium]
MGDRDYRQRETKKPKKASRPVPVKAGSLAPSADVAVVKKARKPRREEES